MPKYDIRILTPAWQDIERIADVHMLSVGPKSAEAITNKLMGKIELLLEQPLMGALHSDEFLAMRQFRKMICGNYIIIYKLVDTTVFIYRVKGGFAGGGRPADSDNARFRQGVQTVFPAPSG